MKDYNAFISGVYFVNCFDRARENLHLQIDFFK